MAPPTHPTPHVELLCYRGYFHRRTQLADPNDLAATQLVFEMESRNALEVLVAGNPEATVSGPIESRYSLRALLRDLDGHLLCLEAPSG